MFLSRMLFAFVFTYFAIDQLTHLNTSVQLLISKGVAMAPLVLSLGIFLQLIGSFFLFFGMRTRLGVLLLLLYLVGSTLMLNSTTELHQPGKEAELAGVLQNTAYVAGLLYVLANGPGRWSADVFTAHLRAEKRGEQVVDVPVQ